MPADVLQDQVNPPAETAGGFFVDDKEDVFDSLYYVDYFEKLTELLEFDHKNWLEVRVFHGHDVITACFEINRTRMLVRLNVAKSLRVLIDWSCFFPSLEPDFYSERSLHKKRSPLLNKQAAMYLLEKNIERSRKVLAGTDRTQHRKKLISSLSFRRF